MEPDQWSSISDPKAQLKEHGVDVLDQVFDPASCLPGGGRP